MVQAGQQRDLLQCGWDVDFFAHSALLTKFPRGGADSISSIPALRSVFMWFHAVALSASDMLSVVCQSLPSVA